MRAVEIIMKKRSGGELDQGEIRFLIDGYVKGSIPDYQVSAWLMAVFFQGMSFAETGYLTRAMIDSGDVLDLSGLAGPLVDKHSTGGVGDKVSLVLAPLAAACGLQVPMMSGRALGHTGGTLDKLDSISGYHTSLSLSEIRQGLKEVGFIMTGQSEKVVPADRLMYALRDVTGTVESVPLITASILSKKFAEGAQSLIFDVKCGSGAFMKDYQSAKALAVSLVQTAKSLGRRAVAVLTDMNVPLGAMTGNFLEVEESVQCLKGQGPADLMDLSFRQCAWMLVAGGVVSDVAQGEALARTKVANGEAWEKFLENVAFQGGDREKLLSDLGRRRSYFSIDFRAPVSGWVSSMDCLELGLAATALGVGRNRKEDPVHHNVGFEFFKKTGDRVEKGEPLVKIWAEDEALMHSTLSRVGAAYQFSDQAPADRRLILEEISAL